MALPCRSSILQGPSASGAPRSRPKPGTGAIDQPRLATRLAGAAWGCVRGHATEGAHVAPGHQGTAIILPRVKRGLAIREHGNVTFVATNHLCHEPGSWIGEFLCSRCCGAASAETSCRCRRRVRRPTPAGSRSWG